LAWKFQVPSLILTDKTVSESQYSFDANLAGELKEQAPLLWDGQGKYSRYFHTDTGVSSLAFPPRKGQVIKADSYTHDQSGITSEDAKITREMSDKRRKKGRSLAEDLDAYETVKVFGDEKSKTALLCWGSNKGVCMEAALKFGLRVIQVLVLSPFPEKKLKDALQGVKRLLCIECNSTGQLARLAGFYGIETHDRILKYDGRPFSLEDLESELGRALA